MTLSALLGAISMTASTSTAPARDTARAGLTLALSAADAWADDARLVWLENDADLDHDGHAAAWGYLFYSASRHAMRSWSVRDGAITAALDHVVSAEAPALQDGWLDSVAAVQAAWRQGGDSFCAAGGGLQSLVLVRGVFAPGAAWVAVFAPESAGPRLFLVLDAQSGDALKRWRG